MSLAGAPQTLESADIVAQFVADPIGIGPFSTRCTINRREKVPLTQAVVTLRIAACCNS